MLNFIGFQVFGNSENAQKFVANKLCSNGFTDFICTLYLYMFNGHAFGELASVSEHIYLYCLKAFFHPQINTYLHGHSYHFLPGHIYSYIIY